MHARGYLITQPLWLKKAVALALSAEIMEKSNSLYVLIAKIISQNT
jgi:hypothetical protein